MKYIKMYNISVDKVAYYIGRGLTEKDAIREVLAHNKKYYQPDDFDIKKFKNSYHIYILNKKD